MKKLILLLLVLVGGVMSANAWGDLYLICGENNNWANGSDGKSDAFKFTCLSENHYRATVPGSYIKEGSWYFRFYDSSSSSWQNISPASTQSDEDVTSATAHTNWQNSSVKAFYITQNTDAKYIHIYVTWDTSNNQWEVSSSVVTQQTTYNVAFTNPSSWSNVRGYAFLDGLKLTDNWPGEILSENNGVYFFSFNGTENARIIFNDGGNGDTHQTWTFDVTNNAVYTYDAMVGDQTVTITNDYGTFASPYPLTFPENGEIYAYKATEISNNKMIMERVIGTVPAKTGLFIEKKTAGTMTVSPCATVDVDASGNYLKAGGVSVTSDATADRYGFQTQSSGVGFYKITGNAVAVPENKAYLELPAGTVNAPSLSIEIDGETTGIKLINWEDVDANNDGQIYDLQGRRVYQPTTGIYIKNGKKVIVK